MHALDERHDAWQTRGIAHVFGRAGAAVDEAHDDDTGLGVHHFRRDAGGDGGHGRGALVEAHDVMHGNVVADAHEVARLPSSSTTKLSW